MIVPLPNEDLQLGVGLETGAEYLGFGLLIKDAVLQKTGLPPTGSVLDIGCGSGRIARHFVDYTRPPGRYVGMDIQRPFINWCKEHLSQTNERLEFYHQDIYNGAYNLEGKVDASEYLFPFEDASFDAIILYSVFTHLLPQDAQNYLGEIARLLKPGGHCFSSWFLMTTDVGVEYLLPNAREGQVGYGFPHCIEVLEEAGLRVDGFKLGRWNGGESEFWQDLLWLRKAEEISQRFPSTESSTTSEMMGEGSESIFSGTLERIDSISGSLTVSDGTSLQTAFGFSQRTRVQAHGKPGTLSDLRIGQRAHIFYAEDAPEEIRTASKIVVGSQRPRLERLRGIVEVVDWDANTVTLSIIGKGSVSVRMHPDQRARINGRVASARELRPGQVAAIQAIFTAQDVMSRDPTTTKDSSDTLGKE